MTRSRFFKIILPENGAWSRVDYTARVPSFERSLDALARVVEYKQVCVAIVNVAGRLIISSNNLNISSKPATEVNNLSPSADGVLSHSFSKLLGLARCDDMSHIENMIYNMVALPYSDAKPKPKSNNKPSNGVVLGLWVASLEDGEDKRVVEGALQKIQRQAKAISKDEYMKLPMQKLLAHLPTPEEISVLDADILGMDKLQKSVFVAICKNLPIIHARASQDAVKLARLLKQEEFRKLLEVTPEENFVYATRKVGKYEMVEEGKVKQKDKDHHAEMNIIEYLERNNKLNEAHYIGVSKLSCFGCHIDIALLNETHNIGVRGGHGVRYPSRMESKWHQEDRATNAHEGKYEHAHKTYTPVCEGDNNNDLLFADLSDAECNCVGRPSECISCA